MLTYAVEGHATAAAQLLALAAADVVGTELPEDTTFLAPLLPHVAVLPVRFVRASAYDYATLPFAREKKEENKKKSPSGGEGGEGGQGGKGGEGAEGGKEEGGGHGCAETEDDERSGMLAYADVCWRMLAYADVC